MNHRTDKLQKELQALRKINRVLMERVERSIDISGSDFALFEYNILLQKHVEERTAELEKANARLMQALEEQRRISRKLVESEERYRLIFDQSRDAMMTLAPPSWRFTSGNAAICALFEVEDLDTFTKLDPWTLSPPRQPDGRDSVEKSIEIMELAMRQGSHLFEWAHKRLGGEVFPATVLLNRIELAGAVLLYATVRDITEQKRAEQALVLFKESLENSTDAIGMSTPQGRHYFHNRAFRELFGDIGGNPAVIYADKAIYTEVFDKIMAGGAWTGETRMFARDGQIRDILLRAYANKDPQGTITALVGVHTDITGLRRSEEERQRLQAQLLQAHKMESVGRLAGGVAHDFNNMLSVILGQAEIALTEVAPASTVHARLQQIMKTADSSAKLVSQLLAFARKQTIAPRILDLNETVGGMMQMLQRLIGENIELTWVPGRALYPVRIDPSQLDQVLANLCVNARDAIIGGGRVTVETKNVVFDATRCAGQEDVVPGEYVMLGVSDNGCGMDQMTLSHLFEPFFTTKEISKGTGLGLPMVYGIVKQNEGFINVYSEPGRGTTFTIYLPRHHGEVDNAAREPSENTVPSGRETVLLVEDEPVILDVMTETLKRLGYSVIPVVSAVEAVRLAQAHNGVIHLLITDVVMPEMNGRELADRVMTIHPGVKVLFMSGYTADVIAHHGILEPGVDFIQKPFSMTALATKIRSVLERDGTC